MRAVNRPDVLSLIKRLNTEVQLGDENIDSTGRLLSDIGGDYSPFTIQESQRKGRAKKGSDRIDLHDTGEFWESFFVKVDNNGIDIEADTIKDGEDLRDSWGENIIGLTEKSLEIVRDKILQNYQEELRKELGL